MIWWSGGNGVGGREICETSEEPEMGRRWMWWAVERAVVDGEGEGRKFGKGRGKASEEEDEEVFWLALSRWLLIERGERAR